MTITVRMEIAIQVDLPVPVPESAVDEQGVVTDEKFREAAIVAAIGSMPQSCEIDVSGYLGIPFKTTGPDCSLAKVFNEASDTDVIEVEAE